MQKMVFINLMRVVPTIIDTGWRNPSFLITAPKSISKNNDGLVKICPIDIAPLSSVKNYNYYFITKSFSFLLTSNIKGVKYIKKDVDKQQR